MPASDFPGAWMVLALSSVAALAAGDAGVQGAPRPVGARIVEAGGDIAPDEVTRIFAAPGDSLEIARTRSIRKVPDGASSVAVLALRIQFERDSADIPQQAKPQLDSVAKGIGALSGYPRIEVRGHTDSTGSQPHNESLSARRAAAVRAYLIDHGVSPDWLDAQGAGSREPVDAADATAAVNRRVEFRRINP